MYQLPTPIPEPDWQAELAERAPESLLGQLQEHLADRDARGITIYPQDEDVFRAFELTPFGRVRVVILGQDPYHGAGQAQGLAFSVPCDVSIPPSLRNIYAELERDLGCRPAAGDLTPWARQGVLLLNTALTVEEGQAGAHAGRGWEQLTDAAVAAVAEREEPAAFLLWGKHAQKKAAMIDPGRHLLLSAPHPSPLSAHRGFIGCGHFSRVNEWLIERGQRPISWCG